MARALGVEDVLAVLTLYYSHAKSSQDTPGSSHGTHGELDILQLKVIRRLLWQVIYIQLLSSQGTDPVGDTPMMPFGGDRNEAENRERTGSASSTDSTGVLPPPSDSTPGSKETGPAPPLNFQRGLSAVMTYACAPTTSSEHTCEALSLLLKLLRKDSSSSLVLATLRHEFCYQGSSCMGERTLLDSLLYLIRHTNGNADTKGAKSIERDDHDDDTHTKMRQYALLTLASIIEAALRVGPTPSPAPWKGSGDQGGDDGEESVPLRELATYTVGSSSSNRFIGGSTGHTSPSDSTSHIGNGNSNNNNDILASIGLPLESLSALLLWIVRSFVADMTRSHRHTGRDDNEVDMLSRVTTRVGTLFTILQSLAYGESMNHLTGLLERSYAKTKAAAVDGDNDEQTDGDDGERAASIASISTRASLRVVLSSPPRDGGEEGEEDYDDEDGEDGERDSGRDDISFLSASTGLSTEGAMGPGGATHGGRRSSEYGWHMMGKVMVIPACLPAMIALVHNHHDLVYTQEKTGNNNHSSNEKGGQKAAAGDAAAAAADDVGGGGKEQSEAENITASVSLFRHRLDLVIRLKLGLSHYLNGDAILSLPQWQDCLLSCIHSEQTFLTRSHATLASSLRELGREVSSEEKSRSSDIIAALIDLLVSLHAHAVTFGCPPSSIAIYPPSTTSGISAMGGTGGGNAPTLQDIVVRVPPSMRYPIGTVQDKTDKIIIGKSLVSVATLLLLYDDDGDEHTNLYLSASLRLCVSASCSFYSYTPHSPSLSPSFLISLYIIIIIITLQRTICEAYRTPT